MKQPPLTLIGIASACALALAVPTLVPDAAASLQPASVASPAPSSAAPVRAITSTSPTRTTPAAGLADGVVLILTRTTSGEAAGTGMVLTSSGQVLTNYHVVKGSTAIEVEVPATGQTLAATVVGHDASKDVALLQLDGASGLPTITPDPDALSVGDTLTAVGNASGGGKLVAASGQVTALGGQVTVGDDNGGSETLTGVIETTAGAVPGDSGGPMFDAQGEVAGMTTAGSQTVTRGPRGGRGARTAQPVTTVSFAVPISDALGVVDQIRSGQETTTVRIGAKAYLGIAVGSSSDVLVTSAVSGGPAAEAGLTAGSVIISIDGTAVVSPEELASVLGQLDPGTPVRVVWSAPDGSRHTALVTLGSSPVN